MSRAGWPTTGRSPGPLVVARSATNREAEREDDLDPRLLTILVRRAVETDTEAVIAFVRDTWDGWDYLPDVWASWLACYYSLIMDSGTYGSGRDNGFACIMNVTSNRRGKNWIRTIIYHISK